QARDGTAAAVDPGAAHDTQDGERQRGDPDDGDRETTLQVASPQILERCEERSQVVLAHGREDQRLDRIAGETVSLVYGLVRQQRGDERDTASRDEGEGALPGARGDGKTPGGMEREEEDHGGAEEVRVVDAAQHGEEERGDEGGAFPPATRREEAMEEEER